MVAGAGNDVITDRAESCMKDSGDPGTIGVDSVWIDSGAVGGAHGVLIASSDGWCCGDAWARRSSW